MDKAFRDACARRRSRLAAMLHNAGGGIAVLPTAPARVRNADNDHPYRGDSNFLHLTGFEEPDSWLLLDAQGRSTLLCRAKDSEREIWDGYRVGPGAAPAALGVDAAFDVAALDAVMTDHLADQPTVWFVFGEPAGLEAQVDGWLGTLRARSRSGVQSPQSKRNLAPLLAEMRLRKDADELATMRRAAAISAGAHTRAMRFCGERFRADPNARVREYEIEAELLHEFRRHGSQSPAYPSIVAAGANACVLHYAAGDTELRAGELCLIDAGCELDGYASDVTRTFPANGRFTSAQRELYDIVLAAQAAAIDATRAGVSFDAPHQAAVKVLSQGLLDTGIVDKTKFGSVDDVIAERAYMRFYMHRTGHWIGMDVHDAGEYRDADGPRDEQGARPWRTLAAGNVLTVEPGLYVRAAEDVPERYWNTGIRIEDDALVTPGGCELLTREVPVAADEIEALMRESNGN
jgi:Xaa-Pro aminopeptidase